MNRLNPCDVCGYDFGVSFGAWAACVLDETGKAARSPRWPRRLRSAWLCPECGYRHVAWMVLSRREMEGPTVVRRAS